MPGAAIYCIHKGMQLARDLSTTPYLSSLLAVAALLTVLGLYSWRRRNVPAARPFALACLFAVLWLAGAIAQLVTANPQAKLAWFTFEAAWQMPAVIAMTCFALEYAYPGRWLSRRNLILLFVPALPTLGLILTDNLHHWFFRELIVDRSVEPVLGIGGWIAAGYALGLVVVNIAAFVWLFVRSPQHRWPISLIVLGQLASRAVFVWDMTAQEASMRPYLLVLSLAIPFAIYAVTLFGFRILDPLPEARRAVFEHMHSGVVVFDASRRVLSLNPAAEQILGVRSGWARGKTWQEMAPAGVVLPALPEAGSGLADVTLGSGPEARQYSLTVSRLQDRRGLYLGHLLMLRDVTEQKRAEAQLLEQQWIRATLEERELLARELHDGLAQDLGFLNMQAQAARLYLQSGQADAAQRSLDRLAEVALEMQGDTRGLIGDLLTVSLPSEGLCGALRQALIRFERQHGLCVHLETAAEVDAACEPEALPPASAVHLLRIMQEALANVRKHAGASAHIGVRLAAQDGQLRLTISDDGQGFDESMASGDGKHFGLSVMRQRAARIGGQLAVYSVPGQGTRVEVVVPLLG